MVARHNPPLVAARSFEAAARHKSFQKAADELNVTPTAISHQVRRLEEYLGQALFVRLNRAVELTTAGAALALNLGELFVRLECALDPVRASERGVIRISAMQSLAAKWLAPRLPQFEALHPQWRVETDVDDKLVDFESGDTDLALRYGIGKYPGLHVRSWMPATGLALSKLPGINPMWFLKNYLAYKFGAESIQPGQALMAEGAESMPAQRRQAEMENFVFGQGGNLPVAPEDAHFEHLQEHLKPLAQIEEQFKQTGQLDPAQLVAMTITLEHSAQHMAYLQADESMKEEFQQIVPGFRALQNTAKQILSVIQKQQRGPTPVNGPVSGQPPPPQLAA